jgi:ketosteroid isomerase-like protein
MALTGDQMIEALHRNNDALNRGEFDVAIELAAPDIVLMRPGGLPSVHGIEAVRAWLEPDAFESQRLELLGAEAVGSRVLTRQRLRARGAGSGIEMEIESFSIWIQRGRQGGARRDVRARRGGRGAARPPRLTHASRPGGILRQVPLSEEGPIDALRRVYELFNAGDFDAAIELAHPDILFVRPGAQSDVKGVDAFRAWMEPDAFESQVFEPESFETEGNRILVHQRATARGAGSGIEMEVESWTVWAFDRDGKATRVEVFLEHEADEARRVLEAN